MCSVTKLFNSVQVWEDASVRTAAGQMACDEALARQASGVVLRVYRWASPTATFGYSQRFGALSEAAKVLKPVRRWSGGGVVFHGVDLTLALVVAASEDMARAASGDIYRAVHEAWLEVVRRRAPSARLVLPEENKSGGVCFESPVEHDIVDGVQKICGGALRRFRGGVLYQGSLHCGGIGGWALGEGLADKVVPFGGVSGVEAAAEGLEREKYATEAWRNLR